MVKKNFITLELGVIGGLLFGIGMCMCLIPEWNAYNAGVVVTAIGAIELLALAIVRHISDGKKFGSPDWKLIGKIVYGIVGTLVLGTGMCMIMIWDLTVGGIVVGLVGIILLFGLIPMCIGLK